MRYRCLLLVLAASLLAVSSFPDAHAQGTGFHATVSVADTSSAQRNHAFAVALGAVLTRNAGLGISNAPGYTDALGKAASMVQNYHYEHAAADASQPFRLQVSFDADSVRQLASSLQNQLSAAVNTTGVGPTSVTGRLWVSNLNSAMDLARLLAAVRADNDVKLVEPIGAEGDGIMLQVDTRAPLSNVVASLVAGGTLHAAAVAHPGADASASWAR
jgi:hypothetical protein